MAGNVLAWSVALGKGYEPRLYPYSFGEVPLGEFNAILDFKIWAKKVMGINCYFTQVETQRKFQVTVYCNNEDGCYKPKGSAVDFSNCPTDTAYRIKVEAGQKKKIVFADAVQLNVI